MMQKMNENEKLAKNQWWEQEFCMSLNSKK